MVTFSNYLKIGDNRYRENFGLSFDEFAVGQKFKHRPGVTLSQQDNKDEALATMNNAQLHYDACYAAKTEWQQLFRCEHPDGTKCGGHDLENIRETPTDFGF